MCCFIECFNIVTFILIYRFFKLHEKFQPGDTYEVSTFYDPEGYDEAIETFELLYREQRQSELDE